MTNEELLKLKEEYRSWEDAEEPGFVEIADDMATLVDEVIRLRAALAAVPVDYINQLWDECPCSTESMEDVIDSVGAWLLTQPGTVQP